MRNGTLLELAETLYAPFSDLLYSMERAGVYVSFPELDRIASEADRDITASAAKLNEYSGQERNWNAGKEVAEFLYDQLGLPELPDEARSPKFWGKERITAHEALEYFHRHYPNRRPEIDTLRQYRRACRAKNYATDLRERARPTRWLGIGVIHPTIGTYSDTSMGRDKTGTRTGRLSISNPPLQQIPRDKTKDPYRVRRAFVAPPGHRLCVVDLEALEVRLQAHIHIALFGDTTLRDMCEGGEFHGDIAMFVFSQAWPDWQSKLTGERLIDIPGDKVKSHSDPFVPWCRDQEKAVFYGTGYGQGAKTFGARLWTLEGDPIGTEKATIILNGLYHKIPAIPKYHQWCRQTVAEKGGIWTLLGRWIPCEKDNRGFRQALNGPMQGGGSEVTALWMLALKGLGICLNVHDELHAVAEESKADATVSLMERAAFTVGERMGLKCPIRAKGGHGASWEESK